MAIAQFMASPMGRIARVVLGVVLIVLGFVLGGGAGIALIIAGLLPIATGALDVCLIAPIAGLPLRGGRS